MDDQAATFVYVDAGQTTDSELRAWGVAHAPLWAALRARTFAVQVVGVGVGAEAADRAAPLLKYWTQDGDGTGATDPTGQTQADPVGGNCKFPICGNRKPHTLVVGGGCPAFHDVDDVNNEGAGHRCMDGRRGCC